MRRCELFACRTCGAAIFVDPSDDIDAIDVHDSWHRGQLRLWTADDVVEQPLLDDADAYRAHRRAAGIPVTSSSDEVDEAQP